MNLAFANDYSGAETSAKNAFLIQSGAQNLMDKTGSYVKNGAPYWSKEVGGACYEAFYYYKHRSLVFTLSKSSKLTLSTNSLGLQYHW